MNPRRKVWAVVAILALAVGVTLAWRHRDTAALKSQVTHAKRRALEQAENSAAPSVTSPLRATVSDVFAEADREAVARLRAEIDQMKARALTRARNEASSSRVAVPLAPSILEEMVPSDQWKNAGQATPSAALETALWAAAGGDVQALSEVLAIDPVVRTQVNAMLMTLPVSLREEYGTAEQLIALLATRDVPLGAARIYESKLADPTGTPLTAVLRDSESKYRSAKLTLRQEGKTWKIVVPERAVERYSAMLKGTSGGR